MEYLNKQRDMFLDLKNSSNPCCECGSGIDSQLKQKRSKALPLGESMTSEAHPIAFGVGGSSRGKSYKIFIFGC